MGAPVIFDGPEPPAGRWWCFVCAFSARARANDRYAGEIAAAERMPDDSPAIHLKIPLVPHVNLAVAPGVYPPLAQFGVQFLCWSHLGGIAVSNVLPAAASQMPQGFGPGGVPLLGQGR